MKYIPAALLRIPLPALMATFLFCIALFSTAHIAHADDSGPIFRLLEVPYPYWYHPSIGGDQDALKYGDQILVTAEIEDTQQITSVLIDGTEIGLTDSISVPLYMDRSSTVHMYRIPLTIASHSNGLAHIRITATDANGMAATLSHEVQLDNVPPAMRLDSLSFVHSTTTPAFDDPMLVSGWTDESETKLYMYNAYYTLLAADGTPLVQGSYRGRGSGVSLSEVGRGTFTNYLVQLFGDASGGFRIAEEGYASSIQITAVLRDGAGNDATVTSPAIPIPRGASSTPLHINGVSNVLFLPGIEGSRLYRPVDGCSTNDCASEKLWDPSEDADVTDLSLNAQGESARNDVYTKVNDTINSISIFKFYTSFFQDLDAMRAAGTITDWKPVAYDWRLSLDELVTNGAQQDDRIYYERSTSTPYIEQTLKQLAATSKTGKVTIVAHSNGGLLTKALLQKIGDAETARLIDQVIFVGVPQAGAPQAFAGLLHGYGTALPADWCATWKILGTFCSKSTSRATARTFAENAPFAYHLLPSISYFDLVKDALHSVIQFSNTNSFVQERAQYGFIIQNKQELDNFALAVDGGRTKPLASDIVTPNILNGFLINYANDVHTRLDQWTPPIGVLLYEIGGWGADTLSGIEYYDRKKVGGGTIATHRPMFVEDGDGTVPIPSALMMPSAENVQRYWLNLVPVTGSSHGNIFEISDLRTFIRNILVHESAPLPNLISTTQPATIHPSKKLLYLLHGPATIHLYNETQQHTGLASDGTVDQGVQGSLYGQLGDTQYLLAQAGNPYHLVLDGFDTGSISLDLQELENDNVVASTSLPVVPVQADTEVTLESDGTIAGTILPVVSSTTSSSSPASTVQQKTSSPKVSKKKPKVVATKTVTPKKTTVAKTKTATTTKSTVSKKTTKKTASSTPTQVKINTTTPSTQSLVYTVLQGILSILVSLVSIVTKI